MVKEGVMGGPLEGIRILDMTIWQQGPAASMYLAEMGAEVIKVEDPFVGDLGRQVLKIQGATVGPSDMRLNAYFEAHNRNKKAIAINLKNDRGRECFYRLVACADVFISNYVPDTLEKLGVDYDTLTNFNPKLIYATANGYGPEGPEANKAAFDLAVQARGGFMSIVPYEGQPPCDAGNGTADQVGALMLAYATMAALLARERKGIGQQVSSSLLGSIISINSTWVHSFLFSGTLPRKAPRTEAVNPFWNTYQAKDGKWFILSMARTDDVWPGTCQALDSPELENDPRFDTHGKRLENNKALIAIFDRIFATRNREEWLALLDEAGVICAPVNTFADVVLDPQVIKNNYVTEIDHPTAGRCKVVGIASHFSRTPVAITQPAPQLGQHTEEVLLELGGYSWEEIAGLKEQGAII